MDSTSKIRPLNRRPRRPRHKLPRRKSCKTSTDRDFASLHPVYRHFFKHIETPPGVGSRSLRYGQAIPIFLGLIAVYALGFIPGSLIAWMLIAYGSLIILFMILIIRRLKGWFTGVIDPFDSLPLNLFCFITAIINFGFLFFFLGRIGHHLSSPLATPFEAIYFSFVTVATVGYGDIVPTSLFARIVTLLEIAFGLWFVVTVIPVSIAEQFELLRYKKESFIKFMDALLLAEKRGEFIHVNKSGIPIKNHSVQDYLRSRKQALRTDQ